MKNQLDFLLAQAVRYIQDGRFQSATLVLKQILRSDSRHFQALRMMGVALAQQNFNDDALIFIDKAISANKRDGIAFSNKGNILRNLGRNDEAILAYQKAIQLSPNYAEAYGNLANAQQDELDFVNALMNFKAAISLDPKNPDFYCNYGNYCLAVNNKAEAFSAYKKAIELQPNHANSNYFLAQLYLRNFQFCEGWSQIEWRWASNEFNSSPLKTSKKRWQGQAISGQLLVWAEQGIGDQILYASMLNEVMDLAPNLIVSVDRKLKSVFERSFPQCRIIDKLEYLPESEYDFQIPFGSLGQFFRNEMHDFEKNIAPYLLPSEELTATFSNSLTLNKKIKCGISWKSNNPSFGRKKSIDLAEMNPLLSLKQDIDFINLQYGDTEKELEFVRKSFDINIINVPDIDLFNDLDGLTALISVCDIVVTASNSTAHFSGALRKETLLLLPYSDGKFWYWQDIDGVSLWYPSIKVFKQEKPGDWSAPIQRAKAYLEKRFEI